MDDREQLGQPIETARADVAEIIGGLIGLNGAGTEYLLSTDPPHGSVLSVIRDAVKARAAYRAFVALLDAADEALRPFADAGMLFTPADASDRSCYVSEPDSAPIGNRLVWETTPLTIGDLRRAFRARRAL